MPNNVFSSQRTGAFEIAVLTGEEEAVSVVDFGLLLESDTDGTSFLLLESGTADLLLLEG